MSFTRFLFTHSIKGTERRKEERAAFVTTDYTGVKLYLIIIYLRFALLFCGRVVWLLSLFPFSILPKVSFVPSFGASVYWSGHGSKWALRGRSFAVIDMDMAYWCGLCRSLRCSFF